MSTEGTEKMSRLERLLMWRPFSTTARTLIILALVVPLLFSGLFMWAMWDPTGSVPQTRLAVVNEDKGVDRGEGAGLEKFGDKVAEGLTSRDYLDFKEVSAEEARDGLLKGKYLFTVTIPENFSENVVTVIDPEPKQAEILIDFNDYNGTNGAVLTAGLVPQIQAEVAAEVSRTYAEEVLSGINELGDGIRAAADGSKQLDDGVGQLQDGAGRAIDGINQLDDGANQLHDGTGRLVSGTTELNDGAYQLKDGLHQLSDGTDRLADGARQIDEGVNQLTGTLIPVLEGVQGGVAQLRPVIDSLRAMGLHDQANKIESSLGRFLPGSEKNLVNDLKRLSAGTGELYANLADPNMPYRNGLNRLVDGANRLADGTDQLADGANQLHDGTTRLADGTGQLVDGGAQLEDGIGRLKDGSNELSTKLGDGAQRAPSVKALDQSSEQIAVPILFQEANLHPTQVVVDPADPTVKKPSSGFSILGLVVINFLLMAVVSILLPHAIGCRHKASGAVGPVMSAWVRMFGINVALTALLGFVSITLGWRPSNWIVAILGLLLIDAAGTSIFQFFRILFGRVVGALFNVGFFAMGLFVAGAVWPLSTLPAPLAALNPLHPMSHARNLFVRSVDGIYDGTFWLAFIVLVVSGLVAVGASVVIYDARRKALHIQDPNENEKQREEYAREIREGEEPLESVFSRG